MSDRFDLRTLIREVCDSSTAADPITLAKEVGERIGDATTRAASPCPRCDQLREALEQALPAVVQNVVSRMRRNYIDPTDTPGGQRLTGSQQVSAPGGQPSRKVARIRAAWQRRLRERVACGPGRTDWKFLEDFTIPDLIYARDLRDALVRSNAASRDEFDRLIELCRAHGVNRLGDLPRDVLARALSGPVHGEGDAA